MPDPRKDLQEAFVAAVEAAGFERDGDQKNIAAAVGRDQSHISRILRGEAKPSKEVIRKLSDLTKDPSKHRRTMMQALARAKGYEDGELATTTAALTSLEVAESRQGKLPVVGQAKCGPWMDANENLDELAEEGREWKEVPPDHRKAVAGRRAFWVRAEGDSMNEAGIQHGDLVLVTQEPSKLGRPALVRLGGQVTIKIVERERFEGEAFVVLVPKSSNPEHKKEHVKNKRWVSEGGITCRIVGVLPGFRRYS